MAEKEYRAKDFMTKYVFSVPPNITIHELIRLFVSHNVSAIPVVDTDNTLLGIVSEGDLLYKKYGPIFPSMLIFSAGRCITADTGGMKNRSASFSRQKRRRS